MPIKFTNQRKNENPAAFSFIHSSAHRSADRRALLVIRGFEQAIFPRQALLSLQGEGDRNSAAAKGLRPAGQVDDPAQACIAPGVGAVEDHDLISLVENDIAGLRGRLTVAGGQALSQGPTFSKPA